MPVVVVQVNLLDCLFCLVVDMLVLNAFKVKTKYDGLLQ